MVSVDPTVTTGEIFFPIKKVIVNFCIIKTGTGT